MPSGLATPAQECYDRFTELKGTKDESKNRIKLKYVIYRLNYKDEVPLKDDAGNDTGGFVEANTMIIVDCTLEDAEPVGDPAKIANKAAYEKFVAQFPADKCRWAVFDYYLQSSARKIFFVSWTPDKSSVKDRMYNASSKEDFRFKLGSPIGFQASDYDEISYETVSEKLERMDRGR